MSAPLRVAAVAFLACALWVASDVGVSSADDGPTYKPRSEPAQNGQPVQPPVKHPKLASIIAQLVEAVETLPATSAVTTNTISAAQPAVAAHLKAGLLRLDDQGRVQVYIRVSDEGEDVQQPLSSVGVDIERVAAAGTLIQASVAVKKLLEVAALDSVVAITPPRYGHVNVGSALTEGDALLGFADLRSALGVDGSGVTVGVISDGINGLAVAVASDDLPTTQETRVGGKLVSTTGGVIATSFRADDDLEAGLGSAPGAEGTAILEIVHDIAPGAQLRFANFSTGLEFMAAVDFLAANSDVVVYDIGFFGKPYDQTSDVSANTAAVLNNASYPIRGYYTSVGNQALVHYQESYVDSGTDGTAVVGIPGNFHQFAATSGTTDCDSFGPYVSNYVILGPGETMVVWLTWDDTFGSATTDYDLFAFENSSGVLVAASVDDNPGVTMEPVEAVAFTNSTGASQFYDIFIQNFDNASVPKTFDMFVLGGGDACVGPIDSIFNYNTVGSSVPAQSDSGGGVVSVGAIDAADAGTDDIEAFSSHGPANNGAIKPDVAAIDGVSVTGAGGFSSTFFGTSAAAPHVAGLAALLLEVAPGLLSGEPGDDPGLDRATLRAAIVNTAVDLGASGDDNTFGSGRVDGSFFTGQALVPEPGPPTSVAAVTGDCQASVSWNRPSWEGASDITQFTVTSTPGGLSAVADGSASSATVTGLIDGTPYTFTVTAANAVGTSTASAASSAVIPINELPVVQVGQDITANEGEMLSLQLATFTDAGISDTHTASVDWGDGSGPEAGVLDQGAGTVSGSHVYANDGAFPVTVTVTDSDGGFGSSGLTVNASNVAPVVNAGQDKEVRAGSSLDIGATFTDAGSGDTHTSTIQWGDGSGSEVGVLDQGAGTVSGSHVYTTQGAYQLTVTVTDDDGGSGFDSVTVIAIPGLTEWGLIVLGSVFGLLVLLQTQRRRPNRRSGSPTL